MALTANASIVELFCELVAIPSPSGRELSVARVLEGWLGSHGVVSQRDHAGEINRSDAGNLIATVPGAPDAPTLLFVAHMDTVETGSVPVAPSIGDDGVIRSGGDTILGADNKAAVAAVMRLCATVAGARSAGAPAHAPTVIAAFTCREESGRMGASLLDPSLLTRVDCAFCVDGARPIGTLITRALGQSAYTFVIHGRTAHAAANPEEGVNAIRVASEIVAQLKLGRLDGGGSASVAAIVGGGVIARLPAALEVQAVAEAAVRAALEGTATNSVPDLALVRGEVRAFSTSELETALSEVEATVVRVCEAHAAGHEWLRDPSRAVPPFPGGEGSRALALARAAGARAEIPVSLEQRHATLEANHLATHTDVVAVASGGREPHQLTESIPVAELGRLERLLEAIVAEAAES